MEDERMGIMAQTASTGQLTKSDIALSGWWSDQFARILPEDVVLVLIFALISSVIV